MQASIVNTQSRIDWLDREITNFKRDTSILKLKVLERKQKEDLKNSTIKFHTLQNRLIGLGLGPIYTIHKAPHIKTNQYSN
jgi:hypothetical protein